MATLRTPSATSKHRASRRDIIEADGCFCHQRMCISLETRCPQSSPARAQRVMMVGAEPESGEQIASAADVTRSPVRTQLSPI